MGETNFHTREIPRSGSKAKDGEKREKRERERKTMVITRAKLRMAHASMHGARKPPGPKLPSVTKTIIHTSSVLRLREQPIPRVRAGDASVPAFVNL